MNKVLCYFLSILSIILMISPGFGASSIKISKDWYIVDGERFLIKGLGYSNARPHEQPNTKQIDLAQQKEEFKIIRKARLQHHLTWKPLSLEELKLAEKPVSLLFRECGLSTGKIMQTPSRAAAITNAITPVIKGVFPGFQRPHAFAGAEPQPSQACRRKKKTDEFFTLLKKSINKIVPKTLVTMSNWVQCDFLDDTMWDLVALNIYIYKSRIRKSRPGIQRLRGLAQTCPSPKKDPW